MASRSKKRVAASSLRIDPNVRCQRIYPVEDSEATKKIADLKTVGIKLSREQAIHLARPSCRLTGLGRNRHHHLEGV